MIFNCLLVIRRSAVRPKHVVIVFAVSLLAGINLAQAETATGTMGVGAEIIRTATLSAENLTFGNLSVGTANTASAVVTLAFNGVSTDTTVLVGMGENAAPATQRNMKLGTGTDVVPYTLHVLEAGGADIATEGAVTLVKVGTTNTYQVKLYIRSQPSTDYAKGTYSDAVVLTAVYAP
jgi:spore coat protein U-like protein